MNLTPFIGEVLDTSDVADWWDFQQQPTTAERRGA